MVQQTTMLTCLRLVAISQYTAVLVNRTLKVFVLITLQLQHSLPMHSFQFSIVVIEIRHFNQTNYSCSVHQTAGFIKNNIFHHPCPCGQKSESITFYEIQTIFLCLKGQISSSLTIFASLV